MQNGTSSVVKPSNDRKGAQFLSRQRTLIIATSWLILTVLATQSQAQTFIWRTKSGETKRSNNFDSVPRDAISQLECLAAVTQVLSGERLEIQGGHIIKLAGIDVPGESLNWNLTLAGQAQRRLRELVGKHVLTFTFDQNLKTARHETLAYATDKNGASINQTLLAEGLAVHQRTKLVQKHAKEFDQAQQAAQKGNLGIWRNWQAPDEAPSASKIKGFSLGLYSRQADYDYRKLLREQVDVGATDVLLITPWFLADFESCVIVPKKHRSTALPKVAEVIRQARKLGLRVSVMPILLLKNPGDDHWRGSIKPKDKEDWFLSYHEFIGAFASICQDAGAQELLVGSEFSSMEEEEHHWRSVIRHVRSRFLGTLSYSANWDHLETIKWWDALDAIGMTGYHSLTKKDSPTINELTRSWIKIKGELIQILKKTKKPYFFSELGYASLDGINKNPWDYVSPETVDQKEQADCYEAWFRAWQKSPSEFRGAFFYTWWRNDDSDDKRQYTIYKKPAMAVVEHWYGKSAK